MAARTGDLLIVHRPRDGFAVVDAVTREHAATFPTFAEALSYAARHTKGSVWNQSTDNRGREMGDPVVVLPRVRTDP